MPLTPKSNQWNLNWSKPAVFCGGFALASVAGYVNVISLFFFQVPASHMTGAVTRLSADLAIANHRDLQLILGLIFSFFLGSALSGAVVGGSRLAPSRRYGIALMLEGCLFAVASQTLAAPSARWGLSLIAFACGMQNAMASSYYSLILRTTHLSGIITDLGVLFGQWLHGDPPPLWKTIILSGILAGFLVGGVFGALAYEKLQSTALMPPAFGIFFAGLCYFLWRQWMLRHPEA